MELWTGTSGYSYKEWKGSFYPEKLAAKDMLAHYAERLPSVEINSTFYRLPKVSVLESWAEQVPDRFRFVIKASRRITHLKRLNDVQDETEYLLSAVRALGDRLGAVLYQLPPNLRKDLPRLEAFLALLTDDTPAAFEFRHPSWYDDEILDCLREHDCALCLADTGDEDDAPFTSTASWGYLRLRRPDYSEAELEEWAQRINAQGWERAYVFFKHEDEGAGPRMATDFLARFG